ncbi:MAG: helix-turn-helix domain-containing protein [Solirubrobacterales bacterium]|nr:helix-turn-helix domain-containing protein [Solirubrobacterales bacterium]MCO5328252.1 helix-turn-helix domain-containing protein [Solirubrobacterales bacterium]
MNGFEGIYSSAASAKRKQEVLERLRAGVDEKKIARDLGIAPYAVSEIVQRLREEGALGGPPPPDAQAPPPPQA